MKYCRIITAILLALTAKSSVNLAKTQWSFLTYMEADNSLAPFVKLNMGDMQKVGSTSNVNMLVQLDQIKQSNVTYRYKILQNSSNLDNSINQPMGINPAVELVNSMNWVKNSYPSENYALVLWNHGNGVLDRSGERLLPTSWFELPGLKSKHRKDRGILYNDLHGTFLDNPGLSTACTQIKNKIGKNIDYLGTDACLMAMLEIAYQVKDSVNYLVASQEVEPGYGWPYASILSVLAGMPQISVADFSTATVHAYANFYSSGKYADSSFTLSAIDISKIQTATTAFNNVLSAIQALVLISKATAQDAMNNARLKTQEFYIPDYVDLINLYDNLTAEFSTFKLYDNLTTADNQFKGHNNVNGKIKKKQRIFVAARAIVKALEQAKTAALDAIVASQAGPDFVGNAHGLSLYFPANGVIDESYKTTSFAKDTKWVAVLSLLQS